MVKLEKFSKPALTVLFVLAVFLFAVFVLSTNASADGVDATAAVETESATSVMSVFEGIGLKNTEYPDANFINFLLCLHGYEKLPANATVTVTAYLPVTNTVFWRSTFDKAYLTFKDVINPVGYGTLPVSYTHLTLPTICSV